MKSKMFARILALSLLFLAIASVGSVYSQSRDRDNPTPLTSNEISGTIDKKTKDDTYYYYSFWANPGEVKVTITVEPNLNIENHFLTSAEFILYDSSSEVIAKKRAATSSAFTAQKGEAVAEVQVTKRQLLVLGIKLPGGVYFDGVGKYKVRIDGAIEFSGKRVEPNAKEQTEPRKKQSNHDLGLGFALSSERAEFHNKAEALRQNKQYREAIENYSREIALADGEDKLSIVLDDAYLYRGDCKLETGDYRGAIADYDQFFKIYEPVSPEEIYLLNRGSKISHAYNSRGVAKKKLGDKAGACGDLRKSCSMGKSEACENALNVCH